MMNLLFCCDGVLRREVQAPAQDASAPAKAAWSPLSEASEGPRAALLGGLTSPVYFENGLTVGGLMRNLAPWTEDISALGQLDFAAFLAEAKNPAEEICTDVSHIELRYSAELSMLPAFRKRETPRRETIAAASPQSSTRGSKHERISLDYSWQYHAVLTEHGRKNYDDAEVISLDFTPLSEWQHLPICLAERAVLTDETAFDFGGDLVARRVALTHADHPGVELVQAGRHGRTTHRIPLDVPEPTLFATIIRGFLWELGFDYSPAQRDLNLASILAQVVQIEKSDLAE